MKTITIYIYFILSLISTAFSAENTIPELVEKVQQSVVLITTYDDQNDPISLGSGFFIDNGDIVTNRHVILGATRVEVKTAAGSVYEAKEIAGENTDWDIMILSLEKSENIEHGINLSTSIPKSGEKIIVISNPLGLEQTVSDGIVSSVRDIPEVGNIIQITAPISEGSSGSPVINMNGDVIGVATMLIIGGQNLNFAVPSERITQIDRTKRKTVFCHALLTPVVSEN